MLFPAHRSAALLAVLVAASPPGNTTVAAQQANARVDSLFSFATSTTPGCAVGAIKDGQVLYARGYGLADIEHQGHHTGMREDPRVGASRAERFQPNECRDLTVLAADERDE